MADLVSQTNLDRLRRELARLAAVRREFDRQAAITQIVWQQATDVIPRVLPTRSASWFPDWLRDMIQLDQDAARFVDGANWISVVVSMVDAGQATLIDSEAYPGDVDVLARDGYYFPDPPPVVNDLKTELIQETLGQVAAGITTIVGLGTIAIAVYYWGETMIEYYQTARRHLETRTVQNMIAARQAGELSEADVSELSAITTNWRDDNGGIGDSLGDLPKTIKWVAIAGISVSGLAIILRLVDMIRGRNA